MRSGTMVCCVENTQCDTYTMSSGGEEATLSANRAEKVASGSMGTYSMQMWGESI